MSETENESVLTDSAKIDEILRRLETLDKVHANIGGMSGTLNSIVETVNGFVSQAQGFMNSGGLTKVLGMFGGRNG